MTSSLSPSGARLIDVRVPRTVRTLVLMLHGGASRGARVAVSPTQLSVLRMIPLAHHVARNGPRAAAVFRVLNSRRGWDTAHTPMEDANWALDAVRDRFEDLPAVLVGHSLGGRAALLAGAHPTVRGVVALNPWVYPDDDVDLSGRRVLFVHGENDRIAAPKRSASVAARLGERAEISYVQVDGAQHAMLRHASQFNRLTSDFITDIVGDADGLGGPPT